MIIRRLVVFGLLVAVLGVGCWIYFRGDNGNKNISKQTILPEPADKIEPGIFSVPVETEHLGQAKLVSVEYGREDLGFNLPEGTKFYAGIDGVVNIAGNPPQQILEITSKDGRKKARYYFSGEALVKIGQEVWAGGELGRVASEPLPTRGVNIIVQYNENGKYFGFTQSVVKTWGSE